MDVTSVGSMTMISHQPRLALLFPTGSMMWSVIMAISRWEPARILQSLSVTTCGGIGNRNSSGNIPKPMRHSCCVMEGAPIIVDTILSNGMCSTWRNRSASICSSRIIRRIARNGIRLNTDSFVISSEPGMARSFTRLILSKNSHSRLQPKPG